MIERIRKCVCVNESFMNDSQDDAGNIERIIANPYQLN